VSEQAWAAPPVDPQAVAQAVEILRAGGLVALPTETVYGLAADAGNAAAIKAVFAAKGRPTDHPLIVHVADAAAVARWARAVPESAHSLMAAFWPGPLTLVLERHPAVPALVAGGQDTIALRSPSHPWARAVLQAFGGALAAPSANSFGRISPTTAEHVRADLGAKPRGKVDLILDGGPCPVGIESTIVDLSSAEPRLLRPGAISRRALQDVLGVPVADAGAAAPRAPGRLEQHYAPRTPLELVRPGQLAGRLEQLRGRRLAVLAFDKIEPAHSTARWLEASRTPADYAHDLYASLHTLDAAGAARILIELPPDGPQWEAVNDRLQRAAAGTSGKSD
jgi:L-threonylcarbamoyladenylate synthase